MGWLGGTNSVTSESKNYFFVYSNNNLLYPTPDYFMSACSTQVDNNNITVVTLNRGSSKYEVANLTPPSPHITGAASPLKTKDAIADSGAMQIFIVEGTPAVNKRPTMYPFAISLADGRQVLSTHMCEVHIDGLPVVLTGHIIPELSIASLFGIVVSTKAGCKVQFDKLKCTVWYNNKIILEGSKDKATNLWMLPIGTQPSMSSHSTFVVIPSMAPV
jgi:hypothetical protein